ncbi:MAG: hypothetical protein CMA12_06720 [Euryarchaeota archaeon]|nr:hypothetical protein [Euryarchaeota archaeon]OUW22135.1 MAG: hypothetical protein CBD33_03680 [Euryarchaeota archaeon TMED173]
MEDWVEHLVAVPYGLWIAWVGVQHFRDPAWFEPIVPELLGSARFWVYASGFFEVLLGLGVALPWFRKEAALGLTVLLFVLYWANLNMWINDVPLNGRVYETHWHVLRGLGQVALVLISLWLGGWQTSQRLIESIRSP